MLITTAISISLIFTMDKTLISSSMYTCNEMTGELGHLLSCRTINFGNISDIQNIIIIINGSQERIGSPDITTRSPVMYLRTLSK